MIMLKTILTAALLALAPAAGLAQDGYFGKNKVNYRNFEWRQLETENFTVYYYQGGDSLARIAARLAENAGGRLSKMLDHRLTGRVPLVIYTSHNDFAQTNITTELIEESVGGFTTVFKNRVVVPFTGSYADLDHVITHELVHAFMFDLFFGKSLESILSRQSLSAVPLWFAEGLAEYCSRGWDPESEMIIKDLAVNQRLIPIDQLDNYGGSYLVYKEGQAVLRYIAERYGQRKIPEMMHMLRTTRSMERTCRALLGQGLEKLSEEWMRSVQRQYWPALAQRQELPEFAKQLTEHQKSESYFNLNPVLSPQGDKIAYISDQGGYAGIYIISSIDGHRISHLVKGEKTSSYEAMHLAWFRGGLSWSPDGRWLAFAAKSSTGDRLYIVDTDRGRMVKEHRLDLDGIYFPDWSPVDNRIVICGLKDGKADLYLTDAFDGGLARLTHDFYDDRHPCWSPDGQEILFSSDRPAPSDSGGQGRLVFGRYRLFTLPAKISANPSAVSDESDSEGGSSPVCLTPDEWQASDPTWSRSGICFVSTFNGVPNLFYLAAPESIPTLLTNALTGCLQPNWSRDGSRLTFIGYHQTGWNVSLVRHPLDSRPKVIMAEEASGDTSWHRPKKIVIAPDDSSAGAGRKAATRFSIDWARGTVGYSTLVGVAGQAEIVVTDMMGSHLFYWKSDLVVNLENSDYQLTYFYLPRRLDYGISYYQGHNYYLASNDDIIIEKVNGIQGIVSYPFNKYQRADLVGSWNHYRQSYYYYSRPDASLDVIIPTLMLVHDDALWGHTGPMVGRRWLAAAEASRKAWGSDLDFSTGFLDLRNYWRLSRRYSLAARLMGGASVGPDPQRFYLGGSQTLRGYEYESMYGTRMALANLEMRIPFIDRLELAFPPIRIYGIRGAFFYDMGAAWSDDRKFQGASRPETALLRLEDLKASLGAGVRVNLYPFMIKLDLAWPTDLARIRPRPAFSFSLGSEY
jgi:Tol biopolymer transport system component